MAKRGAPLGNDNATKSKPWQESLRRALARAGGEVDMGLDQIADQVVKAAIKGDKDAWKEIGDRIDGKATQEITGAGGGPMVVEVVRLTDGET